MDPFQAIKIDVIGSLWNNSQKSPHHFHVKEDLLTRKPKGVFDKPPNHR